jgi:hypothetical protein
LLLQLSVIGARVTGFGDFSPIGRFLAYWAILGYWAIFSLLGGF